MAKYQKPATRAEQEKWWRDNASKVPHPLTGAAKKPDTKQDLKRLGFDPKVGRVTKHGRPKGQPELLTDRELERWERVAEVVRGRLQELVRSVPDARRARSSALPRNGHWFVEAAAGLPPLLAVERALWPFGWRHVLEGWFASEVSSRIEARGHELWRQDGPEPGVLVLEPSTNISASKQLEILRSLPIGKVGLIPPGLTPGMLESVAAHVNRGGGRGGGYSPAKAVELVELLAWDTEGAAKELGRRAKARSRRAEGPKKKRQK